MAIYMKYADVKGTTTATSHKDWITCESLQFGGGRGISTPTGSAKNREASKINISEVVITKLQDGSSSPALLQKSYEGTDGEEVTIVVTTTSDDSGNEILKMVLSEALISGFSTSSGGDRPSESVSINFTKIETTIHNQAEAGTDQTDPHVFTYDIAAAAAA